MRRIINIPPPLDFASFSPSELFRFFFQIGHWTEDSFSDEFQAYTRGQLVSTVTISKWKNKDVIPTRYSGSFFKLIDNIVEPEIARNWVTAFETVWALHSAGRTQTIPQTEASSFSDTIRSQHIKWIQSLYSEKSSDDMFSPSDIYVPLQLSELGNISSGPQDIGDIINFVNETANDSVGRDWIFISGGPGSGKSMTALHMASALCEENIFPIFLRGSRISNIDIDINDPKQLIGDPFSIKSFLEHFRASSFETACLIIDGLDEIGRTTQGSSAALSQVISDLKTEQAACAAHDKTLRIIAFGRDAHILFSSNQVSSDTSRYFALLSLDGTLRGSDYDVDYIQGQDLRSNWWAKYLTATGNIIDPSLPDFLSTEYDDFSDFGSDPLLTYLICHTALADCHDNSFTHLPHERVNELTYMSNKNEIYRIIVDRLSRGVNQDLNVQRFQSVLQHIALAVWHNGDSGEVPLQTAYDGIHDEEIKASLRALNLPKSSTQSPPDILITAFYYRLVEDETTPGKNVIEFTHKTFSEYLVSTLLFDRFTRLVSTFTNKSEFEDALSDWVNASCVGSHSPALADFCQKEASLRFEALSGLDWDIALTLCRDHIDGKLFHGPGASSIAQIQHSSSLLFFLWSCLNLERQKRTGERFKLFQNAHEFKSIDLKSLQSSNSLNFKSGSRVEPILQNQTFLTHSLSGTHLKSADMSQLSFNLGHIENPICEDINFAMTHWSHVKITAASFTRSVFQQVIFHQWQVTDTDFSNCFFQGSRFQGATFSTCHFNDTFFSQCHFSDVEFVSSDLENVVFDRCVFTQCEFSRNNDTAHSFNTQFRHCTFIDMETALQDIPTENIESIISQNSDRKRPPSTFEKYEFEKNLSNLL